MRNRNTQKRGTDQPRMLLMAAALALATLAPVALLTT